MLKNLAKHVQFTEEEIHHCCPGNVLYKLLLYKLLFQVLTQHIQSLMIAGEANDKVIIFKCKMDQYNW